MPSTLSEDTAPFASLGHRFAAAAPMHPQSEARAARKLAVASGARLRLAQSGGRSTFHPQEAAALTYAIDVRNDERVMVFDLGGGTFDVSILDVGGGVVEVIATSGDPRVGGNDWDLLVAEWLSEQFLEQHGVPLKGLAYRRRAAYHPTLYPSACTGVSTTVHHCPPLTPRPPPRAPPQAIGRGGRGEARSLAQRQHAGRGAVSRRRAGAQREPLATQVRGAVPAAAAQARRAAQRGPRASRDRPTSRGRPCRRAWSLILTRHPLPSQVMELAGLELQHDIGTLALGETANLPQDRLARAPRRACTRARTRARARPSP